MCKDLLDDLCVRFAHKIEDQELTIKYQENNIKVLKEENKFLSERITTTAHWIPVEKGYCYECSKCHKIVYPKYPFCPNCGSRMVR